jgi:hypothetical protein
MNYCEQYPSIDYTFRPVSYWPSPTDILAAALRNVQGRNRRAMIRDYFAAGKLEQLDETLLADSLEAKRRTILGLIHPSFMGGEYLPAYKNGEVEIARIELQSTTCDVVSVRARFSGSRILYRVCDEYGTKFEPPQSTSRRPFSLAEFIDFLNAVSQAESSEPSWMEFGFPLSFNQGNLECGADLETLKDFTRIESDVYPELECHYAMLFDRWYATQLAETSE